MHPTTSRDIRNLTTTEASLGTGRLIGPAWVGRAMVAHLAVNQRSPDIGGSIPSRPTLRVTPDWWGTGLLPRKRLGSRPRARTAPQQPVDVVEWRRRRSTKPEIAGSTPAADTLSP